MTRRSQETSQGRNGGLGGRLDVIDLIDIVVALAAIIVAWEALFLLKVYPPSLFPSPMATLNRFQNLVQSGLLMGGVELTGLHLLTGFALVMFIGISVGILMVRVRRFGKTTASLFLGLQSFPSIAWVPFAILLIGLNGYGIIFVIFMSSAFSVMLSTYAGLRNIPPIYLKAARNMGARRLSLLLSVMIPASMPSLITGMRQAWSFSWHAVIGAEMLMASGGGLGGLLGYGWELVRMDQILASMVTIFIIGLATDRLVFYRLERRVRTKWGLTS